MTTSKTAEAAERDAAGILIVDDEFAVRDSLEQWFRKDGHRVGSAADANEALKRLQESAWDVVLVDIKMPGMDGLELQRRIHEIAPELWSTYGVAVATVPSRKPLLRVRYDDRIFAIVSGVP